MALYYYSDQSRTEVFPLHCIVLRHRRCLAGTQVLSITKMSNCLKSVSVEISENINRKMEYSLLLGGIFFTSVLAETEEAATEEEPEAMLGLLDYVLLLAIAGIGYYWFFMRESESDKIPEVSPSQ